MWSDEFFLCQSNYFVYLNLLFQIIAIRDGEGANTWATLRVWGCPGKRQGPHSQGLSINFQTFKLLLIFVFFSGPQSGVWGDSARSEGWRPVQKAELSVHRKVKATLLLLENLKEIQNRFYADSFPTSLTSASRVLTLCSTSVRMSTPWLGCR